MGSSTAQPPVLGSTLQSVPRWAMAMATSMLKATTAAAPRVKSPRMRANYGAVGQEAGEPFGGKHALKEAETAEKFGHTVEKQ